MPSWTPTSSPRRAIASGTRLSRRNTWHLEWAALTTREIYWLGQPPPPWTGKGAPTRILAVQLAVLQPPPGVVKLPSQSGQRHVAVLPSGASSQVAFQHCA